MFASESGVYQKKYDQYLIASIYACVSTLRQTFADVATYLWYGEKYPPQFVSTSEFNFFLEKEYIEM